MLSVIPWFELAYIGLPAFLCGVCVGWFSETRKEAIMAATLKGRDVYDRWAPLLFLLIAALAVTGIWLGTLAAFENNRQDDERAAEAKARAVISCQNGNESRAAQRALWDYIFDLSAATSPPPSPEERKFLIAIRQWISDVFQERDCTDLTKKYPLPAPPTIEPPEQP